MSYLAEKGNAARWLGSTRVRRELGLSDSEAAELWGQLEDALEDCRSAGTRELAIVRWRRDVEQRMASQLLHRPLTD